MAQTEVVEPDQGDQLANGEQQRQLQILLQQYATPPAITDAPTDAPSRPPVPKRSLLRLTKKPIPVDSSSSEEEIVIQCIAAPTIWPTAPVPAPVPAPALPALRPHIRQPRIVQLEIYPDDQQDALTSSSDEEIVYHCMNDNIPRKPTVRPAPAPVPAPVPASGPHIRPPRIAQHNPDDHHDAPISSSDEEIVIHCMNDNIPRKPTVRPAPAPVPAPVPASGPHIRLPRIVQLNPDDHHDAPISSSDEEIVFHCMDDNIPKKRRTQ